MDTTFDSQSFDVFLSYRGDNVKAARELKQRLVSRRLRVWLDKDELRPGLAWQPLIDEAIKASRSFAVLVGKDGVGPWENEEVQTALRSAIRDKRPVIPVLWLDAPAEPKLPAFLENRTWVDFRSGTTEDNLDRLVWGVTSRTPVSQNAPSDLDIRQYVDATARRVIGKIDQANPLTPALLVREINELFNRSTFRFERLSECLTQEWAARFHAAMQTMEVLRHYSSLMSDAASKEQASIYQQLMDDVNGYCLAMAAYLFEETVLVSEIRPYVGSPDFSNHLPRARTFSLPIDEEIVRAVDGPRAAAVAQMDELRESLSRVEPAAISASPATTSTTIARRQNSLEPASRSTAPSRPGRGTPGRILLAIAALAAVAVVTIVFMLIPFLKPILCAMTGRTAVGEVCVSPKVADFIGCVREAGLVQFSDELAEKLKMNSSSDSGEAQLVGKTVRIYKESSSESEQAIVRKCGGLLGEEERTQAGLGVDPSARPADAGPAPPSRGTAEPATSQSSVHDAAKPPAASPSQVSTTVRIHSRDDGCARLPSGAVLRLAANGYAETITACESTLKLPRTLLGKRARMVFDPPSANFRISPVEAKIGQVIEFNLASCVTPTLNLPCECSKVCGDCADAGQECQCCIK